MNEEKDSEYITWYDLITMHFYHITGRTADVARERMATVVNEMGLASALLLVCINVLKLVFACHSALTA